MGKIQLTDELLYEYMPIIDKAMIQALEAEVDYDYEFSEKFEKKMKRLIWKEAHMWLRDFYRFVGRVAVFLICVLAVLFTVTLGVEAYKDGVFRSLKEVLDDSVIYKYFTDEEVPEFLEKEPSYLPEGYEEVSRISSDELLSIVYENEEGEQIYWDCMVVANGRYNVLDSEYEEEIILHINGEDLIISAYTEGFTTAYYEYDSCVCILNASDLDNDEICNIFKSIAEYK